MGGWAEGHWGPVNVAVDLFAGKGLRVGGRATHSKVVRAGLGIRSKIRVK